MRLPMTLILAIFASQFGCTTQDDKVTKEVPLTVVNDTTIGESDLVEVTDPEKFRQVFNNHHGKVRVVTLLSPVCRGCMKGHRTLIEAVKKQRQEDIEVLVVWLPMMKKDSFAAANDLVEQQNLDHFLNFWDGSRALGEAYQQTLKTPRTAWDIYLIYDQQTVWQEDLLPPEPTSWFHQMWGVDKQNFLDKDRLQAELKRATRG